MKLLVTVKQGWAGTVCHYVNLYTAVSWNDNHVLEHPRDRLLPEPDNLKRMSVQMDRMVHVSLILEDQAIAHPRAQDDVIRMRIRFSVNCPKIAVFAGLDYERNPRFRLRS